MMSEADSMDEFRNYLVICGRTYILVNDMHVFTLQEAETVRKNYEAKLLEKLEQTDEKDIKAVQQIEWRLATLRIEERVLN